MMPASLSSFSIGARPQVPPVGNPDIWNTPAGANDLSHASRCRIFLNYVFHYETLKRAELERGWNRARLYDANHQWLRPYMSASGRMWFTWEPIRFRKGDAKFPMPKRNVFSPAIQDEVSRLVGVGTKPYVRVDDPEAEDGAKAARQALLGRNEQTGWDEQNRQGCYHAAMFGQWIHETGWRINLMDTVRRAPTEAMACPTCMKPDGSRAFVLKSPNLDPLEAAHLRSRNPAAVSDIEDMQTRQQRFSARACPSCSSRLEPYTPAESEIQSGSDALGRPMYEQQPQGEDFSECRSPYSFFPENQGVGYQSDERMNEWGFRDPVSLTDLSKWYRNGRYVRPERNLEGGDTAGPVPIAAAVSIPAPNPPATPPASPESGETPAADAPKPESRMVVVGDSDFAANRAVRIQGNQDMFLNMANWLAQQEDLIAIRPRNPEDRPITITADQSSMVRWFTLAIVPALLIFNAVRVYWRKR